MSNPEVVEGKFEMKSDAKFESKSQKLEEEEELSYHVALIHLLATCAEGENSDTAVRCQSFLLLEDISRVITNSATTLDVKAAYVRFLNHVYAQAEIEIREVASSPVLFTIFENFVADLDEVIKANFEDSPNKARGPTKFEYLSQTVSKCLTSFFNRVTAIKIPSANCTQYTTVRSPPPLC